MKKFLIAIVALFFGAGLAWLFHVMPWRILGITALGLVLSFAFYGVFSSVFGGDRE